MDTLIGLTPRDEIVVVGAGGHGQDIAHWLLRWGMFAGFYDDHVNNDMILGTLADWVDDDRPWMVGINDPVERARVAALHGGEPFCRGVWAPYSLQGPSMVLGRHTHLNAGVTATRAVLGDFVTVSPGVTICGDVTVGDGVAIGAGATLCNFVEVGQFATVGAGATVLPHTRIPGGETWVGTPARPVR